MLCRILCVLLFVAWTAERPLEEDRVLYSGLWRSPLEALGQLFVTLPGIRQPAWRILLLAMVPFCLLARSAFGRRPRAMDAAILFSFASVGATFLWGLLRGGSAYQAYFQLSSFVTALRGGVPPDLRGPHVRRSEGGGTHDPRRCRRSRGARIVFLSGPRSGGVAPDATLPT